MNGLLQDVLQSIKWPDIENQDQDQDDSPPVEKVTRICGFLRTFISEGISNSIYCGIFVESFNLQHIPAPNEKLVKAFVYYCWPNEVLSCYILLSFCPASPEQLRNLMKFWIGWEVPSPVLKFELTTADLPTASTCFERLRLPQHYTSYSKFKEDMMMCLTSVDSGFGLI